MTAPHDDSPSPAAVARHGLPGSLERWPSAPLDERAFSILVTACAGHGLHGLLAAAIDDGALPVTEMQRERVAVSFGGRLAADLRVEQRAIQVIGELQRLGFDHRLLKGPAVAHLDYPDPALRSTNDVDLLVRAEQLAEVVEALEPTFGTRDLPERRPDFDRRFAKDITLMGEVQVDLHRTLATGPFGQAIAPEALWEGRQDLHLGGLEAYALQPVDRLLHAAYTAVIGEPAPRLSVLRDIALQLARDDVSLERVVERARGFRAVPVVAAAFDQVRHTLGLPIPRVPVERSDPTRWLAWYRSQRGSSATEWLSATVAIRGVDRKLAYLRALAWPDEAYRRARRDRGRRREWRDGLRQLSGHGPGRR